MRSAGLSVSPFAANDQLCDLARVTLFQKNGDKNSTLHRTAGDTRDNAHHKVSA